jgi:hypothetical protein
VHANWSDEGVNPLEPDVALAGQSNPDKWIPVPFHALLCSLKQNFFDDICHIPNTLYKSKRPARGAVSKGRMVARGIMLLRSQAPLQNIWVMGQK